LAVALTLAGAAAASSIGQQARWLAAHGGVRSSRYGDATPKLKQLSAALIGLQFQSAGVAAIRHAICYATRESGMNVGAVSPTHDHSLGQINEPTHPQFNYGRMDRDPAYAAWAMWVVSSHGRDWSPWRGGTRPC
jgi:hypothetical protein